MTECRESTFYEDNVMKIYYVPLEKSPSKENDDINEGKAGIDNSCSENGSTIQNNNKEIQVGHNIVTVS